MMVRVNKEEWEFFLTHYPCTASEPTDNKLTHRHKGTGELLGEILRIGKSKVYSINLNVIGPTIY